MSKDDFKAFVRDNPRLIKYVNNKQMTWQSFYEMYDMYGDKKEVWEPYLKEEKPKEKTSPDFMSYLKNIDLDAVQESINSIQRVLGVVSDLTTGSTTTNSSSYEPRPLYQHLDD